MQVHKIVIETSGAPRIYSLVGGRSVFPAPQLGTRCVCCDAAGRLIDYARVSSGHRLETLLGGLTGGGGLMLLFFGAILWSSRLALVGVLPRVAQELLARHGGAARALTPS